MKQDKFCVSRTLVYLVLAFFLGAGIMFVVNRINNGVFNNQPKAASVICPDGGKPYRNKNNISNKGIGFSDCQDLQNKDKGSIFEQKKSNDNKYICCLAKRLPTPTPGGKTCGEQNGNWYRQGNRPNGWPDCNSLGSNFTQITNPSDSKYWNGFICCKANRLPTPTKSNPTTPKPGRLGEVCLKGNTCSQ